ncbi:MAG: hypothetical protein NTV38_10855 [Chloroflexi bacterium]|nr:hypothetical protein [Chloroflexota bacterium]
MTFPLHAGSSVYRQQLALEWELLFSGGMVKTVGSLFRQRNINLYPDALTGQRLTIQNAVDKLSTIPQVDHAQAAPLVMDAVD